MANNLASTPWVIDTTSAVILFSPDVKIRHMEWSGYGAGNTCSVQDRFTKVIWNPTPATDLSEVRSGGVGWVYGIGTVTITGGQLRIYLE